MYWGSVRFFKHVLIAFAVLLAATIILCVVQAVRHFAGEPDAGAQVVSVTQQLDAKDRFAEAAKQLKAGSSEAFNALCTEYGLTKDELFAALGLVRVAADGGAAAKEESPEYTKLYPELTAKQADAFEYTDKTVYLTFDDGPSVNTGPILDTLADYDIKATFFVCPAADGSDVARLKRIADEGHTIGIHSATHDYEKIYESVESYLADFSEADRLVYEATGQHPDIFRFPGGSINNYNRLVYKEIITEMTRRGYTYYDWHVDGGETPQATPEDVYDAVMEKVSGRDRAVVLLHDAVGRWQAGEVLERIVQDLQEQGYRFDKLTNRVTPITFGYSPE